MMLNKAKHSQPMPNPPPQGQKVKAEANVMSPRPKFWPWASSDPRTYHLWYLSLSLSNPNSNSENFVPGVVQKCHTVQYSIINK